MTHEFDQRYWEQHWRQGGGAGSMATNPPNPALAREVGHLEPGTALDAGCGAGAEAIWLAERGWRVVAVDISSQALARAAERGTSIGTLVEWVEEDLATWDPGTQFDLVTTHYAHPAMPQLEFYRRIAAWVAPGGTLLIVGHRHAAGHEPHETHEPHDSHEPHDTRDHGHVPPPEATVTAAAVAALLDEADWQVVTAAELDRTVTSAGGPGLTFATSSSSPPGGTRHAESADGR